MHSDVVTDLRVRHAKIRVLARRLSSARKDREVDNAIAGVQ